MVEESRMQHDAARSAPNEGAESLAMRGAADHDVCGVKVAFHRPVGDPPRSRVLGRDRRALDMTTRGRRRFCHYGAEDWPGRRRQPRNAVRHGHEHVVVTVQP